MIPLMTWFSVLKKGVEKEFNHGKARSVTNFDDLSVIVNRKVNLLVNYIRIVRVANRNCISREHPRSLTSIMAPSQKPMAANGPDDLADGRKLFSPAPMHPPLPPAVNAKLISSPRIPSKSSPLPLSSEFVASSFPDNGDDDEEEVAIEDEFAMPRRSTLYLIYLTLVMAGIQIAWSVELAYISPYLLSLGVAKSTLSLIWVAGPVSGVIVQPLIGMLSDRSQFRWGRRRVFIVTSTLAVVVAFIGMGRTKEIVCSWTGRRDWESVRTAVVVLAVVSLILLDLAVNASTPPRAPPW